MSALSSVGTLPKPSICTVGWYCAQSYDGAGPMVHFAGGKPQYVWDFFKLGTCPAGLVPQWTSGDAATCKLDL